MSAWLLGSQNSFLSRRGTSAFHPKQTFTITGSDPTCGAWPTSFAARCQYQRQLPSSVHEVGRRALNSHEGRCHLLSSGRKLLMKTTDDLQSPSEVAVR